VLVPINTRFRTRDMAYIVKQSDATTLRCGTGRRSSTQTPPSPSSPRPAKPRLPGADFAGAGLACAASALIPFLPFVILEGVWAAVSLAGFAGLELGREDARE
jgi:hypothetical protein